MSTGWWVTASRRPKSPSRKTLRWDLLGLQDPAATSATSIEDVRRQVISASHSGLSPETVARVVRGRASNHTKRSTDHSNSFGGAMTMRRTTKVAVAGKEVVGKGKRLQHKAGATARKLKKTARTTAATASRKVKKVVKKAKPSAAVRQAGKLGRAVGGVIGQAIGTVQKVVTDVVKK